VGSFSCSVQLFNETERLIRWAQRNNLISILTDCPHRERLGWLEEAHLNGPSLRYEFDLDKFSRCSVDAMSDSQLSTGLVPDIAPELTVFSGAFRDSPEWGSSVILVPWQQYQFTGDDALLRQYYGGDDELPGLSSKPIFGLYLLSYGLGDWYDIGPGGGGL
jgi:alpha-L-rhamnosidase